MRKQKDIDPSTVVHRSCLSTAAKKAALRLTYLPTTKNFDSLHPTQDGNRQPCPVLTNPVGLVRKWGFEALSDDTG